MVEKNQKILFVVESPNKIKSISKYLGSNYIIKASVGHIMDLSATKEHKFGIDIPSGFKPIYDVLEGKQKVISDLEYAAKNVDLILIGSDNDTEGCCIAFHIRDCLKHLKIPMKRVVFDEITKPALLNAIKNQKEVDDDIDLFKAQNARRCLDRLTGFQVSPFLMKKIGGKLSAGRVQSIAVRLVVDREREIESFKPEEYWQITAQLAKPNDLEDNFTAKYTGKVVNKETADKLKSDLDVSDYKVVNVDAKQKLRNPYPPFTTAKLLQAGAGKYGFAAGRTSKAAQHLYENGHCTYIRTDSVRCSPEALQGLRDWLFSNKYDTPDKPNIYKNKDSSQDAHECIRPTDINLLPSQITGTDDEIKIYKLIWERFVASQMKSAIYDTVSVLIEASKGKHELKANGSTIKYKGWLAISEDFDASKKDEEKDTQLPLLKEKDNLVLVDPNVIAEQKFTQPPPHYSEQSLIKSLEEKGIGRPSTYPTIMSKITDRDYVERKKNTFYATELGKLVVDTLVKHFPFMQYEYTAKMELQLDQIADGKLKYIDMMNGFYTPFLKDLENAKNASENPTGFICEKCNEPMVVKRSKFGTFLSCKNWKVCKNTKDCKVEGDKITLIERAPKEEAKPVEGVKCPLCSGDMLKRDGKFGSFLGCANYPQCKGISRVPYGKKCPDCGNDLAIFNYKGNEQLSCTGYPNCKHIEPLPGAEPQKKKFFKKKYVKK